MYDITSETSFQALDYWYDSIIKAASEDIVIYLVGNKSDLREERRVTRERAIDFSKRFHLQGFSECSAKENMNIKETFGSFYKSKLRSSLMLLIVFRCL